MNWRICSCTLHQGNDSKWSTVDTNLCHWETATLVLFELLWHAYSEHQKTLSMMAVKIFSFLTNLCVSPSCYIYTAITVWHQEPRGFPTPLTFLSSPCQSPRQVKDHLAYLDIPHPTSPRWGNLAVSVVTLSACHMYRPKSTWAQDLTSESSL